MRRRTRFTFIHGLAVSLALHSAIAAPFIAHRLVPPPDEPPTLVIDLRGIESDDQAQRQVLEQVKGEAKPEKSVEAPTPVQQDTPPQAPEEPREASPETVTIAPSLPPKEISPGEDQANVIGTEQREVARTIKTETQERDELSDYVRVLSKKIRENLVYPASGHRASAVVSFTILTDGKIKQGTLKIVESTGQPTLDASALQTIRASAPFGLPPKELSVAIIVDFERKR